MWYSFCWKCNRYEQLCGVAFVGNVTGKNSCGIAFVGNVKGKESCGIAFVGNVAGMGSYVV